MLTRYFTLAARRIRLLAVIMFHGVHIPRNRVRGLAGTLTAASRAVHGFMEVVFSRALFFNWLRSVVCGLGARIVGGGRVRAAGCSHGLGLYRWSMEVTIREGRLRLSRMVVVRSSNDVGAIFHSSSLRGIVEVEDDASGRSLIGESEVSSWVCSCGWLYQCWILVGFLYFTVVLDAVREC